MDTKREHRKSRLGCLMCKTRKVKCDEKKPLCSNCAKRFPGKTSCYYGPTPFRQNHPPRQTATPSVTSSEAASQASEGSSLAPQPPPRATGQRGLEMRLWHHYLTHVAHTLPPPNNPAMRSLWTEEIPVWAERCDFLMDSILGITAISLYIKDEPAKREAKLLKVAYNYYADAAAKYRTALLGHVDSTNAGPILATSMFIGFQSKIVPRIHAEETHEPYELPLSLFYLQRGVTTTYKAVEPHMKGHRLLALLFATMPEPGEVEPCEDESHLPPEVHLDALAIVHQLDAATLPMGDDDRFACKVALAHVLAIHRSLERDRPERYYRRCVPAWFWMIPWRFVELLERQNPIAMLILARYFAVSMICEDLTWWVVGLAQREVLGIASIMPPEWQEFMEIPRDMVLDNSCPQP